MRRLLGLSAPLLLLLGVPGCLQLGLGVGGGGDSSSSDSSGSDSSDDEDDYDVEPGSCNAWKVSYCSAVKVCGSVEEKAACQDNVGYVVCLEDAPFAACAKSLDAIDTADECSEWPQGCEALDIAERTSPYLACVQLYQAICEWRQYCDPLTNQEDCERTLDSTTPCSSYLSVVPDVAQACIDSYARMTCESSVAPECAQEEFLKK